MKKTILIAAAAVACACTAKQPKVLVLYYSQNGATESVAKEIAASISADIEAFDVEDPYNGTYDETIQRCIKEREDDILSPVRPLKADISRYDIILLGYPVWFGEAARPALSLARDASFTGKKVITFCTFGSGGLESSTSKLRELIPDAEVIEGYGVRNARLSKAPAEIENFLIKAGLKDGEAETYQEFSETRMVTKNDAAVFYSACRSYQMPLGDPVSVSERPVPGGKEYRFTAEGKDMTGKRAGSTIYVLAIEGETPEFTKVVR